MIECKHGPSIRVLIMKLLQILLLSMSLLLASSCGDSSNRQDLCNDEAWDACAGVARSQCGLTSTASDRELETCKPFVQCEDAAYDSCMSD